MTVEELASIFKKLGARDPESWARSQVEGGVAQLHRFLFLRQAWRFIVSEDDHDWIREELTTDPVGPGGAIVPALRRLLAAGARQEDITTVVRVMQWGLLFRFTYLLEDPGDKEDEVKDIAWRLVQVDEDGNPIGRIDGLHESVLEMEPTGREMRPKGY
jgi:hypothetical protein